MHKPRKFIDLVESIKMLPGIGTRNAERLAYHIIENEYVKNELMDGLDNVSKIKHCQSCGVICDNDICTVCANPNRQKKLCIVSTSKELFQFEESGLYTGYYHVIGGEVDIQKGVHPEDLNIESIQNRINELNIKEVILALNFTIQGEITAKYINGILKDVDVTSLAKGIPLGGSVEYLDNYTLQQAFNKRNKI